MQHTFVKAYCQMMVSGALNLGLQILERSTLLNLIQSYFAKTEDGEGVLHRKYEVKEKDMLRQSLPSLCCTCSPTISLYRCDQYTDIHIKVHP